MKVEKLPKTFSDCTNCGEYEKEEITQIMLGRFNPQAFRLCNKCKQELKNLL